MSRTSNRRPPLLAAVLALASGCATTATLSTHSGELEGVLLGGDAESLVVENEAGVAFAVPRRAIREIDHPGNVLALVGGILGGTGALSFGINYSSCRGSAGPVPCIATGTYAAVGAGMLTWGLWVWLRSRFAVDPGASAPLLGRAPLPWPPGATAPLPSAPTTAPPLPWPPSPTAPTPFTPETVPPL